jgi:hypothetical protein
MQDAEQKKQEEEEAREDDNGQLQTLSLCQTTRM